MDCRNADDKDRSEGRVIAGLPGFLKGNGTVKCTHHCVHRILSVGRGILWRHNICKNSALTGLRWTNYRSMHVLSKRTGTVSYLCGVT